ncbi:MAG: type I restriction endonuclease [Methanobacteriaceae archaeon]|nr:type I restriction endonuclease [Methanobacteriaceae archaeon]
MDLQDELNKISDSIDKQKDKLLTEEATKTALILPFIKALGYDIFDPSEIVPEFNAHFGTKKDAKVDYAIMIDDKPVILFECKSYKSNLDIEHESQLFQYFSATESKFGILTNGIEYLFFTDIEKANKMDSKPFFEFNMNNISPDIVKELKKFTKPAFDLDEILHSASELKYTREIKKILAQELESPSEEFVKFFAKQVYPSILTQNVKEKFEGITKTAFNQFIKDQINSRLESAKIPSDEKESQEIESPVPKSKIVTTEDEWEGFYIVRAILSEMLDVDRVNIRDKISYCGILLDDSNRKPICRLRFNTSQRYLGLFDENKNEEKVPIEAVKDIYNYSEELKKTVIRMLES